MNQEQERDQAKPTGARERDPKALMVGTLTIFAVVWVLVMVVLRHFGWADFGISFDVDYRINWPAIWQDFQAVTK